MIRVSILVALLSIVASVTPAADAAPGPVVGASWAYFQEERWQRDERALRKEIEAAGGRLLSADAQGSSEKQTADIENLLARGVDVLVVVPHDAQALLPAILAAQAEGVPVIAYDRVIEVPNLLYVSFENREVGRLQAREILRVKPRGNFVYIKGAATDPNSALVHAGQRDVLDPAVESGQVRIVADHFVEGWLPERARQTMDQVLVASANEVDAVVCSNDGMAGGVAAALAAQGMTGVPISGQDADRAALSRIARGEQTMTVWKDVRALGRSAGKAALSLAAGTSARELPGVRTWKSETAGIELPALLLEPIAITRENLARVIDSGWASRADVCRGASTDVRACQPE